MKIDIEKLERKTPFPEPSEDFFGQIQARVISQTLGKEPIVVKKQTKVFSLNLRWMAAAAVILIAGVTAFLGFNNNPETSMSQQNPKVDSAFEIQKSSGQTPMTPSTNNITVAKTGSAIAQPSPVKAIEKSELADSETQDSSATNNVDAQDYAFESSKKPESEVEKVLAAFTPDQLRDLDKNSEQDVYLDLYN
ncbi:MAG: hypothetical protein L6262_09575 [Weeksellaceae bacterium]|nr:hypothetical protein [Weeksellaceae bacterium]